MEQIALTYVENEFSEAKISDHCLILAQDDQPADQEFTVVDEDDFEDDSQARDERGDWGDGYDSDIMDTSSEDEPTEEQELTFSQDEMERGDTEEDDEGSVSSTSLSSPSKYWFNIMILAIE